MPSAAVLETALRGVDPKRQRILSSRLQSYMKRQTYGVHVPGDSVDMELINLGMLIYRISGNDRGDGTQLHSFDVLVTELGCAWLARISAQRKVQRGHHDSLIERLAQHLRDLDRLVWTNTEFLPLAAPGASRRKIPCRPDVFGMVKTLAPARAVPTVYEVKASRADLLADLRNQEKRAAYMQIADRVIYVTLPGIASVDDIPDPCGLWVEVSPGEFQQLKRPKTQKVKLRAEDWLNLLLKLPGAAAPG